MGWLTNLFIHEQKQVTSNRSKLPLLNELTTASHMFLTSENHIGKKKALMKWVKATPEVTAFHNKIATNATSKFKFIPVNPKESNRNKIMKANKFALEVGYRRQCNTRIFDMLSTGEGFGLKMMLKPDQLIESVNKSIGQRRFSELKQIEGFLGKDFVDEELRTPRKLRTLASTTVEINYNKHDITGYNQIVNTNEPIRFNPEEIIHHKLLDRDGKVNGYSPIESCIVQLELLRLMWQNVLAIHQNGGGADKVYILKNTQVNTPAYQRMEQQLMDKKIAENRHGDLLLTGDVDIKDVSHLDEMQFKESGLYITGLLAMQYGIPKSSIPYIVGGTNTQTDAGGDDERGYWDFITDLQETYAAIENTQFWIPNFGVMVKFENTFSSKDIQKETYHQLKFNNVKLQEELLMRNKKQLNKSAKLRMLGLNEEDLEDLPEQDLTEQPKSNLDKQLPKSQVNNSDSQNNRNQTKKVEQAQSTLSNGVSTGMGSKEIKETECDTDADIELKEMTGAELNTVPLDTFVKIYLEDKAYHPGKPPRIFKSENSQFVTLKFKSTDFVIRTIINQEDIEDNRVKLMNLDTQFYRI